MEQIIEIVPAVLESTLQDIEAQLHRVQGAARNVQLDVVDGLFAPHKTWPFSGTRGHEEFEVMAAEQEGLPLWDSFDFEADLMLSQPARGIEKWASAGFSRIIVHAESSTAQEAARALRSLRGTETSFSIEVGIALSATASPDALAAFEDLYDFVQVMGIQRVGFQGEAFDERALILIRQVRQANPERVIQVDGGVRLNHVRALKEAGANRLIVGSAIFGSEDPKRALEALERAANS